MNDVVDKTAKFRTKLPTAVRQAAERIAELERKAQEADETVTDETPAEPTATPAEPSPAPEAKPVGVQKEHDDGYWERRAKTLQGMLESASRDNQEKLKAVQEELAALKKQMVAAERTNKQWDIRKYIPETELEELDEKQLSAAFKAAVAAATEDMDARIKERVEPLENELRSAREDSEKARLAAFHGTLNREIKNLKAINEDPAFLEWLEQRAPFQKVNRLTLLRQAEAEMDAETIIEMFDAFVASRPQVAPVPKPSATPDPVAPSVPSGQESGAPVMRRAEIRKFYDEVRRGRIKEGTKAFVNMERKIALAQKAGTLID